MKNFGFRIADFGFQIEMQPSFQFLSLSMRFGHETFRNPNSAITQS